MQKPAALALVAFAFACASSSQGQPRRSSGDLRSRMARCSGSASSVTTPRAPGAGASDAGVEVPGPYGRMESSDIGTCPDEAAPDAGPGR